MHWWKKGILFFLSSFLYLSCSTDQEEEKLIVEEPQLSLQIIQHFIAHDNKELNAMDSLIEQFNTSQDTMIGYMSKNSIDNGNWLICSQDENDFLPIKEMLNKKAELVHHETSILNLWRIPNNKGKLLKEISIAPHPTEGFVLLMRKRDQE
jgi:hypothetical protein